MPLAASTPVLFRAQATFSNNFLVDITTAVTTLWTTTNSGVLRSNGGGNFTTISAGCAVVQASSGGVTSQTVPVSVTTASPCPSPAPATARLIGAADLPQPAPNPPGGILHWVFDAGAPVRGRVLTSFDGTVNFIAGNVLHAVSSRGAEVFRRVTGAPSFALSNGVVFIQGDDNYLYALRADGSVKWRTQVARGRGPLAVAGTNLLASDTSGLIAVDADSGSVRWHAGLGDVEAAAAGRDGAIAAGVARGRVASLSASGEQLWSFAPQGGFAGGLAADASGTTYCGGVAGLYAIDSYGAEVWHFGTTTPALSGPVVDGAGHVFFAADKLYALDIASGAVVWSADGFTAGDSAPALTGDGGLFIGGGDGALSMLTTAGTSQWSAALPDAVESTAAIVGNVIYIGSDDGRLYAIKYQ